MTSKTIDPRVQIPEKFGSREEKNAMLEKLAARLARAITGSDEAQSLANKLAKARSTPVARKKA